MTKDEVIGLLKLLKTSYPRFYTDMSKQDMLDTIDLWHEMFIDENPTLVMAAVKNLINTFKWPPTIADVKEQMYKLTEKQNESPVELYNYIKKAIRNSGYNSYEEFEKLPDICKKFVGSPNQLKEWAIDPDFNDGVVRGQFMKQVDIMQQREKDNKLMLPQTRELINKFMLGVESDTKLLS